MGGKAIQGLFVIATMTMVFLSFARFTEGVAGGELANPGEFPHAVQLSSVQTRKLFCGGSIIAPGAVLTAAHCLIKIYQDIFGDIGIGRKSPESILVTAGTVENLEWSPFQKQERQSIVVDRYVEHPEFSLDPDVNNDIALLFLKKPLIYNDKVQPVQLPPPNVIFPKGTVAGWGFTDERNLTSNYLKKIEFNFKNMNLETDYLRTTDLDFCAIFARGNGPCQGDSGSSVSFLHSATAVTPKNKIRSLRPTIFGIVSWGMPIKICGKSPKLGVFPDVSQYLNWIQDTMEAEGFGNLTKPLTCSESEGFFDCEEFGKDGKKIKSRCILIEKKCDGINHCENGRDESDVFCAAKNASDTKNNDIEASSTPKPEPVETNNEETQMTEFPDKKEKVCVWFWLFVSFATLILICILIAVFYWVWNRSRSPSHHLESGEV